MHFLKLLLSIIFIVSLFIKHKMFIGGIPFPYHISVLSGFLLLLLNIGKVNLKSFSYMIYLFFIIIFVTIYSINTGYNQEKVKGIINLFFAFISSYGFFLEFSQRDKSFFNKFSFIVIIFLLTTSLMELTPFFKNIFSTIRYYIYDLDDIINNIKINRDFIIAFGIIRPSSFASETSHLALYSFVFSLIWFLTSKNYYRTIIFLILSSSFFIIIRSPIIIFNFLFLFFYFSTQRKIKLSSILFIFIGFISIYILMNYLLDDRVSMMLSGSDNSFNTRLIRPLYFIYLTVINHPLFGVGIMNNEHLLNLYLSVTNDTQFYDKRFGGGIYIINSFSAFFVYFGILGSGLIAFIFNKFITSLNLKSFYLFSFITLLISLSIGSFAGQRLWSFIFIFLSILVSLDNSKEIKNDI